MKDLSSNSQFPVNSSSQVNYSLPRSSWNSEVALLKAMFKVKKALDKIEKTAN